MDHFKILLKDQVEREESWNVIAQTNFTMHLEHVDIIWSNAHSIISPHSFPRTRMAGKDINVPRILGVMAARRWIDHFRLEYRAQTQAQADWW